MEKEGGHKSEALSPLLHVQHAVMVGDRHSDIEAGKVNGLYTIACDFGFATEGELDGADDCVTAFPDILPLIEAYKESLK
jgi:phosphoglycolate phosphatase-like HAD superfamily hydrolase